MRYSRRHLLLVAVTSLSAIFCAPARAVDNEIAEDLVRQVNSEIIQIISSGQSESAMLRNFEQLLNLHADLPTIGQSVLGASARIASGNQLDAFYTAFQGYISRKYGRRFREFIGSTVTVTGTRETDRFVEVTSTFTMRGQPPFEVRFRVWDRSGSPRFIDIFIDGISLVITERNEIDALLEQVDGDIDALTANLLTRLQ